MVVYGFCIYPLIPYQDPTPEMTQKFNYEAGVSENIMTYGFWVSTISLFFIIVPWFLKKKLRKQEN